MKFYAIRYNQNNNYYRIGLLNEVPLWSMELSEAKFWKNLSQAKGMRTRLSKKYDLHVSYFNIIEFTLQETSVFA